MEDVVPLFLICINGDFPGSPVNISLDIPPAGLLDLGRGQAIRGQRNDL